MTKKFRTDFINMSGSRLSLPLFIEGGQRITLERGTPERPFVGHVLQPKNCLWAPYTKIEYFPDGSVKAHKRRGFKRDKMDFPTLLRNESRLPIQMLGHQRGTLFIPQEIDCFYSFNVNDPQAEYSSITFTAPKNTGEMRLSISGQGEPIQIPVKQDIWKIRRGEKHMKMLIEARMKLEEIERQKDLDAEERRQLRKLRLQEEGK